MIEANKTVSLEGESPTSVQTLTCSTRVPAFLKKIRWGSKAGKNKRNNPRDQHALIANVFEC